MNNLIREIMSIYPYDYDISVETSRAQHDFVQTLWVPRWDIGLLRSFMEFENNLLDKLLIYLRLKSYRHNPKHVKRMHRQFKKHYALRDQFKQQNFTSDLHEAIVRLKEDIENRIATVDTTKELCNHESQYLILARSPEPEFYNKENGQSEITTYGTSRRALTNIEKTAEDLNKRNISVGIFEPGKHNLIDQIKVFQSCKGIIAIKGAEFANILWMQPSSHVILIKPDSMKTLNAQKELAVLLGLRYSEIVDYQGNYPVLNANILEKQIKNI